MKRSLTQTIDESGDFGAFQQYSPYYIVAILFHDSKDNSEQLKRGYGAAVGRTE